VSNPAVDVGSITDRDDPAIGHGNRLGRRLEFVDGEDSSLNDQVSGQHEAILPAPENSLKKFRGACRFRWVAVRRSCEGTMDAPLPN
jgi:hypothetical protein